MSNNTNIQNHKQRKSSAKNIQKSREVLIPITRVVYIKDENGKMVDDGIGQIVGYKKTNEYRQIKKKERNNPDAWRKRIVKSHEFGNQVAQINKENYTNDYIEWYEQKEIQYKQFLISNYGEEEGNALYLKHQKEQSKI